MRISKLTHNIQTSPIITLAAEINERIQRGEKFYNLTIGDFNPKIYPIPEVLKAEIFAAYDNNETNYPGAFGVQNLRETVNGFLQSKAGISYDPKDILIASGGRPLIYSAYLATVDPGEKVLFPVPSWNNDYYTDLTHAEAIMLETTVETNFMPTAEMIAPHLENAALLSLCSPLNPTGTTLSQSNLEEICDLILEENRRRGSDKKPLYLFFDQIYWLLTHGATEHYHVVKLRPEMRDYTISMAGVSKAFSGTGVRVGWAYGPADVMAKMRTVVAHMGAWAPRAEQVATGKFLANETAVDAFLEKYCGEISTSLNGFYNGFMALKEKGYSVDAVKPQAAMYLTVQLDLSGKKTESGRVLETNANVHRYILDEAKIGLVPFSYFGASETSSWYRLSVGTCHSREVGEIMASLESALERLLS